VTTTPPVDDRTRDLWNQAGLMVQISAQPILPKYVLASDQVAWAGQFVQAQATTFAALVQMDLANQIRDARKELQP
jgi:hypothetical protein